MLHAVGNQEGVQGGYVDFEAAEGGNDVRSRHGLGDALYYLQMEPDEKGQSCAALSS